MTKLINLLQQFGEVEECLVTEKSTHIKITKGFQNNIVNIVECQTVIYDFFNGKNLIIKKYNVENNFFHLILQIY